MTSPRPSFFIAGNSKSGTSALYQFLKAHPGVFMCRPKEPNYHAKDFLRDPDPEGAFHPMTEAAYLALFREARPEQRCGEASACYLYSREAAREIHAFDPAARIVILLREPVDFLYSYYLQLRKNPVTEGETAATFSEALALEPERKRGQHLPPGCLLPEFLYYSDRVRYAEQLERFFRLFDRSQVRVILYDDFARDNAAVYREVLAFMELDQEFTPVFRTYNEGAVLRSKALKGFLHRLTLGRGKAAPLKAVLTRFVPGRLRRRWVRQLYRRLVFKPKEPLDPALVRRLKEAYRGEVERLGDLLGRDLLSLWGYDGPGRAGSSQTPSSLVASLERD